MGTIGVVTTVWNQPDFLRIHLDFLRKQTRYPDRVVIVDDFSDPDMMEEHRRIAEENGCWFIGINYYGERKIYRRAQALNAGFSVIDTDYILVSCADFLFPEWFFERVLEFMERYINVIPTFKVWMVKSPDELVMERYYGENDPINWSTTDNLVMLRDGIGFDGPYCLRRDYPVFFPPKWVGYGEDNYYMAFQLLRQGCFLVALEDIYCFHLEHEKTEVSQHHPEFQKIKEQLEDHRMRLWLAENDHRIAPIKSPE